jgi:type II secretory pathway predicted ATPase ExeA
MLKSVETSPRQQSDSMAEDLVTVAERIDAIRQGIKPLPSIRAWTKRLPGLGSDKTWRKILKRDFGGLSISSQLVNYKGVLASLETDAKERADEEFYSDLDPAQVVSLTALRLMQHHGKDRLVLIEGGSGSGKTTSLELLKAGPAAGMLTVIEADETWKSLRAALGDILEALAVPEKHRPVSTAGRLRKLLEIINQRGRIMLAIDEAQHCTGQVLNCIKTILNRSEALIILAGMNTLLRKLRFIASEESKQLFHNRLFAKVELSTPGQDGAAKFLNRRLAGGEWKKGTLAQVVKLAANAGHWAFLRRVSDLIRDGGITGPDTDDATLLQAANQAQAEIS